MSPKRRNINLFKIESNQPQSWMFKLYLAAPLCSQLWLFWGFSCTWTQYVNSGMLICPCVVAQVRFKVLTSMHKEMLNRILLNTLHFNCGRICSMPQKNPTWSTNVKTVLGMSLKTSFSRSGKKGFNLPSKTIIRAEIGFLLQHL